MSATRVVLLGAPGAGKGTQASKMVAGLGVPHVSTGDMLRDAVAAGTELGKQAKAVMDSGKLVGDDIVIGLARQRLAQADAKRGFVLDGFPRTEAQAEALDAMLAELGTPLECCLAITTEGEAVVKRLLARAEIEGRPDDNEETIRERMQVYESQTAPLLDYYRKCDLLVEVDGMGTVDEVFARVDEALRAA